MTANPSFAFPTERALRGIIHFLSNHIELKPHDGMIVCFEENAAESASWLLAALEAQGQPFRWYCFDRRDVLAFSRSLGERIRDLRRSSPRMRVVVLVCEVSHLSFTDQLIELIQDPRIDIRRLLSFTPDLFELAFNMAPPVLRQINAGLLARLIPARKLRITSDLGTDLEVELDSRRYQWISNYGIPQAGELIILPPGEINTFPAAISGRFVASGAIHFNCPVRFDTRLAGDPITFELEGSEVRSFQCHNPRMRGFLRNVLAEPFAGRVGELGFGTNTGIDRWVAYNSHINERRAGVHLGLGEHVQPGRVAYTAKTHLDVIGGGEVLHLDDGGPPIRMDALEPVNVPHPAGTHSEDAEHSSWRRP